MATLQHFGAAGGDVIPAPIEAGGQEEEERGDEGALEEEEGGRRREAADPALKTRGESAKRDLQVLLEVLETLLLLARKCWKGE